MKLSTLFLSVLLLGAAMQSNAMNFNAVKNFYSQIKTFEAVIPATTRCKLAVTSALIGITAGLAGATVHNHGYSPAIEFGLYLAGVPFAVLSSYLWRDRMFQAAACERIIRR